MSENSGQESNIFDLASKKAKKEEPKQEAPSETAVYGPSQTGVNEPDDAVFSRCKEKYEEVKSRMNNFFDKTNLTPKMIRDFVESPTSIPSQKLKEFESSKKEYEKKINSFKPKQTEQDKKPEEKLSKDKKNVRVSKKGWIPMR